MSSSRKIGIFSFASLVLISSFVFYYSYSASGSGLLEISFLNVGQGDAIYIEAPNGVQFLVDGGPANGRFLSELGSVMPYWDRTLDGMIVTNPDTDHYAGFLDALGRYDVGMIFAPGTHSDTATYSAFVEKIEKQNIHKVLAQKDMKIVLDRENNVYIEILFPDRDVSNWTINDGSVVARLVYASTSVMLQGDSSQKIEKYLIAKGENLNAQILKIGHHGSKTATAPEYVSAVSPQYAVISNGEKNRYGHPHQITLDTLEKENVSVLRTDLEGRITFISDGKTFIRK